MPALPQTEWIATLDRIGDDLERSLADLDRFERDWASSGEAASSTSPEQVFAWLERRLGAWDAKLSEAARLAESVEVQLAEREASLTRWHTMFARWRDLIQQREEASASSMARDGG
jgi:hypothetical protein